MANLPKPPQASPEPTEPKFDSVELYTAYPGQAPQVIEDQVPYPLTTTMLTVPKSRVVRGFSFFGVSFVYVIFEDGTDIYWARSGVMELAAAEPMLVAQPFKIRFPVCRCFTGPVRSASRMASITGSSAPSFGFVTGFLRV
jgi:hypothetical protein